jgi:glyoxylase-like metal-dependent hydrolase (beta-lactamase superfamily II)
VVSDEATQSCAIIDPVLNLDLPSGKISTESNQVVIEYIKQKNYKVEWILETHVHADHLSGAHALQKVIGGKIAIGANITTVQVFWQKFFNLEASVDGAQFDRLFVDGDTFYIGQLEVKVMHTPGHTPACVCYSVEDAVFVGDTIFMPHLGTARADFPGGSAEDLYASIQKLFTLPEDTRVFVGHDYPEKGQEPQCQTTIAEQKNTNKMINSSITKQAYVEKRQARDATLAVPRLLLPSIQVNMQAGAFFKDDDGQAFLKLPLNKL